MGAITRQMEELGNKVENLGNAFTTGYRAKGGSFHETLTGMKVYNRRDLTNGMPVKTNRELDFALEGVGYFEVEMPDGTRAYTRNGSFNIGPNGQLLSNQGYPIVVSAPKFSNASESYDQATGETLTLNAGTSLSSINIPTGAGVTLNEDGTLRSDKGEYLGKLSVVTFTNVDALQDVGDGLFVANPRVGEIQDVEIGYFEGQTHIKQGYVEQSNVSIVNVMTDMVQLNTSIKAEMKIIKLLDQMQESLNSTITKNI